jgi:5-methylthioadenosine/S-adenosylhomocysteine deaminase
MAERATPDRTTPERTTIANGTVVTLDDDDQVLVGGTVVIDDDLITYVGPAEGAPRPEGTVIDATGKAVLPGLVDLHYHTAIAKGWSDHLPLWEYLDTLWYPAIRALDDDAAYWAALASYAESVKCGVTAVNDMYRRLPALARAAEEIGIRAVLSNDIADPEHDLDSLHDTRAAYAAVHGAGDGRVEVAVGIEWLPMASEGLLRDARALADELGVKFHIHLNESMTEVENSLSRFGRRPTEVAYDCGVLGPDCIAAHCVWLSDREIGLMAETGTHISHNPGSNAKLGNGVARLPEMMAAGINVGLGHDAAECNNSRDLFESMKFASIFHRAVRQDASLGQPSDILRMATVNGGRALGHHTGRVAPGWKADVILVDLSGPMFVPLLAEHKQQLYSHLVFAANGSCVDTTIIDGRVVMAGRRLASVDEELVCRKANEAFVAVLGRMVVPDKSSRAG